MCMRLMDCVLLSYFIIFQSFLLFSSYNCLLCNLHDKFALLQFKNSCFVKPSLGFDSCSMGSCKWDGVTCNSKSGHVIGLDLSCEFLRGEPLGPNSSIFRLRHLQQLSFTFNNFSGSHVYFTIGDFVNLKDLTLFLYGISGYVPSTISHLSKLVNLYLSSDSKMSIDPYTWNKLILNATNLSGIYLYGFDMSFIRESSLSLLTNLSSSLYSLYLPDAQIQVKLPTNVLQLPNLQEIDLSWNENLRGELIVIQGCERDS